MSSASAPGPETRNATTKPDGQAVLTDFGITGTACDPSVTRTGIVLGIPGYMAPERANGMPATPAADLWSLGATLYAALCGQGPFDDRDDALAMLSAVANEDPPHLTGDGSLYEIVNALLCRDPAVWPAFHEIARALDAAAANAPVTARTRQRPSTCLRPRAYQRNWTTRQRRRRRHGCCPTSGENRTRNRM